MSDRIRQIIRAQWNRRNSRSLLVREEARNLIRVHVQMLRGRAIARDSEIRFAGRTAA